MHRIKGIAKILEPLAVIPLSATIEPDWDQGKDGKALLRKFNLQAKQLPLINHSAHFPIDVNHPEKLTGIVPPPVAAEKVKRQHHPHTVMHVIHHGQHTNQSTKGDSTNGSQTKNPPVAGTLRLFIEAHEPNAKQEAPEHVLVKWIYQAATHHQIKRKLREQGKYKQSSGVTFPVLCVEEAFHRHKRKNGKGQPSQTGHPVCLPGDYRCPKMVTEHKCHGHNVQHKRCDAKTIVTFAF